tara:strand:+ start:2108 stop:2299 length:192 start_codon:yes stop_codon:yes gene_type:complete
LEIRKWDTTTALKQGLPSRVGMLKTLKEKVAQRTGLTGFFGLAREGDQSAHLKAKSEHFDKKK